MTGFGDLYLKIPLILFLAHHEPKAKAHGELIVYQSSRRLWVCVSVSVCMFTFSNMNISETNGSIVTKFYLKHHWVGGKNAIGFEPDRIRTLVYMATDSSHRDIMGKCCEHFSAFIFNRIFFILAGNENI